MTLRGLRSMVWRGEQFRDSVRDERLFACWVLSMYSLRRSELLGLRWSDIDPDAGVLHVRQGRVAVAGGGSVVDDPESHRSRRALPLPAEVAEALRSLKARQKKEAFALGVPWSDDRFVAVSEDGEPGRLEWFSDEFHRLRKRAGLRRIKLHALRNTSVSLILDQGKPVHVVAAWHGHDRRCHCRSTPTRRPTNCAPPARACSADVPATRPPLGNFLATWSRSGPRPRKSKPAPTLARAGFVCRADSVGLTVSGSTT